MKDLWNEHLTKGSKTNILVAFESHPPTERLRQTLESWLRRHPASAQLTFLHFRRFKTQGERSHLADIEAFKKAIEDSPLIDDEGTIHIPGQGRRRKQLRSLIQTTDPHFILLGNAKPITPERPFTQLLRAVLKEARCPVLLVPETDPTSCHGPVLVGVREKSDKSFEMVRFAASLAAREQAPLKALRVLAPQRRPDIVLREQIGDVDLHETDAEREDRVHSEMLNWAQTAVDPTDVPFELQLRTGDVATELHSLANRLNPRWLVLGAESHLGHGAFDRKLAYLLKKACFDICIYPSKR